MKTEIDLNRLKNNLVVFLKLNGIGSDEVNSEFESDYESNWNKCFYEDLIRLIDAVKVFEASINEDDRIAQSASFMYVRLMSLRLNNFFNGLFDDVEKIYLSEKYNWEKIPKEYKFPKELYSIDNSLIDFASDLFYEN